MIKREVNARGTAKHWNHRNGKGYINFRIRPLEFGRTTCGDQSGQHMAVRYLHIIPLLQAQTLGEPMLSFKITNSKQPVNHPTDQRLPIRAQSFGCSPHNSWINSWLGLLSSCLAGRSWMTSWRCPEPIVTYTLPEPFLGRCHSQSQESQSSSILTPTWNHDDPPITVFFGWKSSPKWWMGRYESQIMTDQKWSKHIKTCGTSTSTRREICHIHGLERRQPWSVDWGKFHIDLLRYLNWLTNSTHLRPNHKVQKRVGGISMLTASILGTQIKCHQKLSNPAKPTSRHVRSTLQNNETIGNWPIS